MKTYSFSPFVRAALCASTLITSCSLNVALAQTPARTDKTAQTPARPDKIMTIAELRTCMKLEQTNKKNAAEILQEQDAFKRDQEAVKAEQVEVKKTNDDIRARLATLAAERDAISTASTALSTKAQAAKTDEEKAAAEADRVKLAERNRQYEQDAEKFNAMQPALRDRVTALNERIDAINQRNKTINERVEPHQAQVATWRSTCSNRRFRKEDEIVIKKELAAGK